jgi:hypothetical protein
LLGSKVADEVEVVAGKVVNEEVKEVVKEEVRLHLV